MKGIALRAHEVRRLGTHGSVLVVRVVTPQPEYQPTCGGWGFVDFFDCVPEGAVSEEIILSIGCPLGEPGEERWVKETWACVNDNDDDIHACPDLRRHVYYRADAIIPKHQKWRPSIHQPRWASRYTARCTDVRVGRVQDVEQADALAAGMKMFGEEWSEDGPRYITAIQAFAETWQRHNLKHPWDSNPWCWMVMYGRAQ